VILLAIFFLLEPSASQKIQEPHTFSMKNLALFPILIFTFNFTPCIQRFAKHTINPDTRNIILGKIFILFFIFIIVLAISNLLTQDDIIIIKNKNVDALFYTAGLTGSLTAWFISALLLLMLTGGAYIGTLTGIIDGVTSFGIAKKNTIIIYNILICTIVGTINPSIIKIISHWSIPIIVITVFFIPSAYFLLRGNSILKTTGVMVIISGIAIIMSMLI